MKRKSLIVNLKYGDLFRVTVDQFLLVLKELDIFSKNEQAVTLAACHLPQYPILNKVIHQSACGIGLNFQQLANLLNINHWMLIQVLH